MSAHCFIFAAAFGLLTATACGSSVASEGDDLPPDSEPGDGDSDGSDNEPDDPADGDGGGAEPTALRLDQITLLDPHAFVFGGLDITETVNGLLLENVQGDDPADGVLDLSVVAVFRALDPAAASTGLDVAFPDCTAPAETTLCTIANETNVVRSSATNSDGPCMSPYPDTTGAYEPPVTAPGGRCFESGSASFSLAIGDLVIPLRDVKLGARYSGPAELSDGLIAGFLTESEAETTVLPDDLPVVGGETITAILRQEDKDSAADGTPGWWFYLSFTASEVALDE